MDRFVARHAPLVTCTLSGFDRIVFRGHLQLLHGRGSMHSFLVQSGVRSLDFKDYALKTSKRVIEASLAEADRYSRPEKYLQTAAESKEELARELLKKHPLEKYGLICAFRTLEPCMTFEYRCSKDPKERGFRLGPGRCLHIYKYFLDSRFGFMSARLQTWFPFNIQVCLNGREWLGRQLERRGSRFKRADNCFPWLGNPALAQRLMTEQLKTNWPEVLTAIARCLNPLHAEIFALCPMDYYWSAYQTEWATDVVFKDPKTLASLYPRLVHHAMHHFQSPDVMRFLARKAPGNFTGEIVTSFKDRAEGVRVKHWMRGNSVKMYDKAGSILRVETTIARTDDFKVLRPPHDNPDGKLEWKPLRKGVADLHRRAEVSQRSNERYLDALAVIEQHRSCSSIFDTVAKPVIDGGRRFRALRIGDPDDIAILQATARGEFATAGFRNRDLRQLLHPRATTLPQVDQRRLSASVSRKLRLLRAHGLIKKVPKTHRYQLTERGRLLTSALRATREATLDRIIRDAA
jgi:hypothetical protein